jgi:hypothetical protein
MISRMALSAAIFTVASGSRMLKRYCPASAIFHCTVKSMSMMFWSPVSIRLSCSTSRRAERALSLPAATKPMSICCTEVTLGVSAVSMGQGRCQLRPGWVVSTHWPKRSTTPCSLVWTR